MYNKKMKIKAKLQNSKDYLQELIFQRKELETMLEYYKTSRSSNIIWEFGQSGIKGNSSSFSLLFRILVLVLLVIPLLLPYYGFKILKLKINLKKVNKEINNLKAYW